MREHPQPPAEVWSRNVRDRVERAPQLVPRDAFGLVDGETIDPIESARVMAVLPLAIACVLNIDDVLRLERRSVKGECLFALVPVDGVALKHAVNAWAHASGAEKSIVPIHCPVSVSCVSDASSRVSPKSLR